MPPATLPPAAAVAVVVQPMLADPAAASAGADAADGAKLWLFLQRRSSFGPPLANALVL